MIIEYTLIMGIIVGAISILAVVFNYVYRKHFALGGVVLVTFGTLLLGLSLWQSIELSIESDGSITAKYQQDLGAKAAEKNRKFKDLEIKISTLMEDIELIKKSMPVSTAISNTIKHKRKIIKDTFSKNSQYYVLIFHKLTQTEHANALTNILLDEGYNSSATAAELTTFAKQLDENMAMVIYTDRGKNILPQIKKLLKTTNTNIQFIFEPNSRAMRQGDIQILLF